MNGVRKEQSVGLALVRDSLLRCVGVCVGVGAEDFGGVINARVADVDSSCNNEYIRRCVYIYTATNIITSFQLTKKCGT